MCFELNEIWLRFINIIITRICGCSIAQLLTLVIEPKSIELSSSEICYFVVEEINDKPSKFQIDRTCRSMLKLSSKYSILYGKKGRPYVCSHIFLTHCMCYMQTIYRLLKLQHPRIELKIKHEEDSFGILCRDHHDIMKLLYSTKCRYT